MDLELKQYLLNMQMTTYTAGKIVYQRGEKCTDWVSIKLCDPNGLSSEYRSVICGNSALTQP